MVVANDAGDPLLRFNGATWTSLAHSTPTNGGTAWPIPVGAARTWMRPTGPANGSASSHTSLRAAPSPLIALRNRRSGCSTWPPTGSVGDYRPPTFSVEHGTNLTYVCKYRNWLFFIELNTMNAWYLPLTAAGGELRDPAVGSRHQGGRLLFCATWSIDAGDGIDDKLVFCTDLGELLIFTGSNPATPPTGARRAATRCPCRLGMNAHLRRRRPADRHHRRHRADAGAITKAAPSSSSPR